MKIISKFQDYYDSAMGYGVDTTQVLIRKTTEVGKVDEKSVWDLSGPDWIRHSFSSQGIDYDEFVVGFCGKFYKGVKVKGDIFSKAPTVYLYDVQSVREYERKHKDGSYRYYSPSIDKVLLHPVILKEEVFFQHNCPVLLWHYVYDERGRGRFVLTKWPCLKDIGFQRIIDPYTAFQEINMYQFGVLGCTEKDICEISDKDRLDQRGFDMKYGFRKRPKQ